MLSPNDHQMVYAVQKPQKKPGRCSHVFIIPDRCLLLGSFPVDLVIALHLGSSMDVSNDLPSLFHEFSAGGKEGLSSYSATEQRKQMVYRTTCLSTTKHPVIHRALKWANNMLKLLKIGLLLRST